MKRDSSFFLPTKTQLQFTRNQHEVDPSNASASHAMLSEGPSRIRSIALVGICLIGLVILFSRVAALQTLQASSLQQRSNNNRIRTIYSDAPRGAVVDRNGKVLAGNAPDIGVYITTEDFPKNASDRETIFSKIASVTNSQPETLQTAFASIEKEQRLPIEPALLIPHISQEQAIALAISERTLPGIHTAPRIIRDYPKGESFAHILGYVGKMDEKTWQMYKTTPDYLIDDLVGKSGVEDTYETLLKGTHAKETIEVDATGHAARIVSSEIAKTGQTLTLTIDAELQQKVFDELQREIKLLHSTGGSAVALDPQNGEILALVSMPSFDNNAFAKQDTQAISKIVTDATHKPLFNRAISGEYPSGSTIKPVIAAAALQEHIITDHTTVNSTGGIRINQWFFPDWKAGGHGVTNVIKAIAESVNTFFYTIGGGYGDVQGLGVDRIREYAEKFGLNAKTDIDLPSEATGFLPTKDWKQRTKGESWYIGDTYHLSIGQGDLLVTPLQVAQYTAAISNGGTLYKPHLKKVPAQESASNDMILTKQVVSGATLAIVRRGMRETVLSGSARSFQSLSIPIAAKTGTAQFGSGDQTHAWFTCFAPYDNPQIALTIMIEGGGEGSSTAAPVAKNILDWWAKNRL